jgi:hypothetical protein
MGRSGDFRFPGREGECVGDPRCRTRSCPMADDVASRHDRLPGDACDAQLAARFCYHAP